MATFPWPDVVLIVIGNHIMSYPIPVFARILNVLFGFLVAYLRRSPAPHLDNILIVHNQSALLEQNE